MDTIGSKINELHRLRMEKQAIDEMLKGKSAEIIALEQDLIQTLDQEDMQKATGKTLAVSVGSQTRYNVDSWTEFFDYVYKNKAFHLLERRLAQLAAEELYSTGEDLPFITAFTKRKLNVRAL